MLTWLLGIEMIQYLFPHFQYGPVITAIVFSFLIGFISYGLVFRTSYFDVLIKEPLVPNFISVPATMFALLMAFMASSVWQNSSLAKTSVWNERLAIEAIASLPIEPEALKSKTSDDLLHYVDEVAHKEWGDYFNQKSSIDVDRAIKKLEQDAWQLERDYCRNAEIHARCSSSVITSAFFRSLDQLKLAREQRLTLGGQANFGYVHKWIAVYFLGIVTAINIAAGHKNSRRAAIIALIIFCTCAGILYASVALHIHPYKGPDALQSALIIPNSN